MLAALLVIVLSATFALVVVAGVHSRQLVDRADASAWRAGALEQRGLADVVRVLRWRPSLWSGSVEGADDGAGGAWQVTWGPEPPTTSSVWPRVRARLTTAAGRARWHDDLMLELRAEPWATGVTCREDADVEGRLVVSGSGVYVGGCLRGRENVRFSADTGAVTPGGLPADGVHGDVFAVAAVHAGPGVFARGAEIHDTPGPVEYPDDSDRHSGAQSPAAWFEGPSGEFLLAAGAAGTPPGSWFDDGRLRLALVPPAAGTDAVEGRCLVLPAVDEVVIEGSSPPAAGRLLVVVRGDAVVGRPGEAVELAGGLVVCGQLTVYGDFTLTGSLHAGNLRIAGQTLVSVPPDWREHPLPGAARPTLAERGG
jgi:hypothetical protein